MTARRQNLDYQMAGNASLGHEICVRRALDESNMLLDLWRGSVAATHAFLAPDEVEDLVPEVLSALEVLDIWVAEIPSAASNDGKETSAVGFVGLLGSRVEALFVASDCFGRGIGTALLNHARTLIKADILVDCNEENPKALEFYQRRGFLVTGRSPGDSRGRPHPLVHLRLPGTDSEDDLIFPNELFIQIMDRLSTLGHLRSLVTTISASRRFYQLGLPVLYRSITLSEAIHGSFNPNKSTLFPPFVLNIDPLSQIRNLNVALMNPIPDPVSLFSRILPSSRSITLSTESSSILQPLWHALYLNQCPFLETMNLRHSGKTPDVLAMFPIPHFPAIPTSVRKVRITVPSTGPIKRLFLLVDRAENVESCHLAGAVHRADAERLEQFHPGLWSRLTSLEANEKELIQYAGPHLHLKTLELKPWDDDGRFWDSIGRLGGLEHLILRETDTKFLFGASGLPFTLERVTMRDAKLTTGDFEKMDGLLASGILGRVRFLFSARDAGGVMSQPWEKREKAFWIEKGVDWVGGVRFEEE